MAQFMERMLSVLHTPDEGKGAEGTPVLDGSKPFKHYRRKKTNKAPRKRAFIASMTRQPAILTDALASCARGTGQGVGGSPPPASLSNSGPSVGSVPAPADSQAQQQIADANLRSLPVVYQPVVFGSKHALPPMPALPAAQPYFYDAELAAALAEYQPTSQPQTSFASSAFRAVTTTLDQLPPSTVARSICTGLEPAEAPVVRKSAAAPTAAAKQIAGSVAAPAPAAAQAQMSLAKSSNASATGMPALGHDAMNSQALATAASAGHSQQSWMHMQMQGSITSPLIPGPSIPCISSMAVKQQARYSQLSGSSGMSANELARMPSTHSSHSSGTPVASGDDVFQGSGMVQGASALMGFSTGAPIKTESGMSLQQQVAAAAASPPLLVLPLDPAGWSKLPPRAQVVPGKRAWGEDDALLWNPNRVACHTLLDTGAYGAVYRGILQSDDEAEGGMASGTLLRPSPFAEVAVKLLRPGQLQASPELQAQVLRSFQVEAELLPSLSHPNVVPVWYVNADPAAGAVCLVQELATLGTLADYIHGRPRGGTTSVTGQAAVLAHRHQVEGAVLGRLATQLGLPAPVLLQRLGGDGPGLAAERRRRLVLLCLLRDVAMALSYLATLPQPVVHRDVKPANVLISAQGKALLADFGVAKLMPGAVSQASDWDAFQPATKRARTCSADGTSGFTSSQSPSPTAPMPAAPWSPAASAEEETDWMEALLKEDMPVAAPAAHVLNTVGPVVDADSLGWLHDLLGQDNDELLGLHVVPAAAAPSSPAMSGSAGGSSLVQVGSEAATGFGWGSVDAMQAVPSPLDHDLQGTAHYAAPEDLMTAGGVATTYALSPAADVFSLGYCIWEALSAQRPWAGMRAAALATSVGAKGARLPVNRGWALPLQSLLRRAWQADPAARPSADEVAGTLEAEMRAIVAM